MLVGGAWRPSQRVDTNAGTGNEPQTILLPGQQNAGAEELAAKHRSVANPLKEFVL
jgi:hypothetical protein